MVTDSLRQSLLYGEPRATLPRMSSRWTRAPPASSGARFAHAAFARGMSVRGLTGGAALHSGVEPVRGDLADGDALARLVRGAGVVVHLAAYAHRCAVGEAQRRESRGEWRRHARGDRRGRGRGE